MYERAGVAPVTDSHGFHSLLRDLKRTFSHRPGVGKPLLDFGQFANVIDLGTDVAVAIATDGIGTKAIVAQMLEKYDTVGIDCIAMNVNDVICVGAEPIAMTDYLAIDIASDEVLTQLGKGLLEGAIDANITIPGGEISQIPEIVKSVGAGTGFDLVGTCLGVVHPDRIIVGESIQPGDAVIGFASSGIHSNGLTLARRVLIDSGRFDPREYVPELGKSVGEELLVPTLIYVKAAMELLSNLSGVRALVHITSDGFLNLRRVLSETGFVIDSLPEVPPIFGMIQELGGVDDTEMYEIFNMGIGFCVVVSQSETDDVLQVAKRCGHTAWRLGYCEHDANKQVGLKPLNLVGDASGFRHA